MCIRDRTYYWVRLGCFNYAPTFFGTSLPEVVDIKENQDGTVTLTVEAVCDMVICDDAVITHELTVRFAEDGSFQYLGNKILNDGIMPVSYTHLDVYKRQKYDRECIRDCRIHKTGRYRTFNNVACRHYFGGSCTRGNKTSNRIGGRNIGNDFFIHSTFIVSKALAQITI